MVRLAELKETEKMGLGLEEIEAKSLLQRGKSHKVIPSREELSRRITEGEVTNKLLDGGAIQTKDQANLLNGGDSTPLLQGSPEL